MNAATAAEFSLRVTLGDRVEEFRLGATHIHAIIMKAVPGSAEFAGLYAAAAYHPAAVVRQAAAHQEALPCAIALDLADDPSPIVRYVLTSNPTFRRIATEATVLRLIDSDPHTADAIAEFVGEFQNTEIDTLCEVLVSHPDPAVRQRIALHDCAPAKWLKRLLSDSDRDVVAAAAIQLAGRDGY